MSWRFRLEESGLGCRGIGCWRGRRRSGCHQALKMGPLIELSTCGCKGANLKCSGRAIAKGFGFCDGGCQSEVAKCGWEGLVREGI